MCNKVARAPSVRGEEEVTLERRARAHLSANARSGEIAEDLHSAGETKTERQKARKRERARERKGQAERAPACGPRVCVIPARGHRHHQLAATRRSRLAGRSSGAHFRTAVPTRAQERRLHRYGFFFMPGIGAAGYQLFAYTVSRRVRLRERG